MVSANTYYLHALSFDELWKHQHGRCLYCDRFMVREGNPRAARHVTREHVFPRSLGLPVACIALACAECNNAKGCRMPTTDEANRFLAVYERAAKILPRFALPMECVA